ncbi:MAG: VOC family protein, partial [Verrucomicrobiales bacterium]|nr:VOC family protein [Verrucomicrobiales bacterium]
MKEIKNPPPGQNNVSPYLVVKNASGLLDFIKEVFNGEEGVVMRGPDNIIMHGEARVGESVIMLADACERVTVQPARLHVYVPDVDATYKRALAAGATSENEPADQFYGDRS